MSIAGLIRRMTDAGAPPEAIALAVEEIEAMQACLDSRRVADRDRKRAQRERQKTADVTGQSEDSHATVMADLTPSEVSPQTPLPNSPDLSPLNPPKNKIEVPAWMPPSYAEFRAMRKAMRNIPFGEGAERRVIAKITKLRAEGHCPDKLLSKAIERGHRSVFEDESTRATVPVRSADKPMNAAEIQNAIAFWKAQGRPDKVAALQAELASHNRQEAA